MSTSASDLCCWYWSTFACWMIGCWHLASVQKGQIVGGRIVQTPVVRFIRLLSICANANSGRKSATDESGTLPRSPSTKDS